MSSSNIRGAGNLSNLTATAGTVIMGVVPPAQNRRYKTRIYGLSYVAAATAHAITIMKALGKSALTAAAASGATTLTVASLSFGRAQSMAASDFAVICLRDTAGKVKYQLCAVSGVTGLVLTVGALEAPAPLGAEIWYFGTAAETGGDQVVMTATASARTQWFFGDAGVATSGYLDEASDVIYSRNGAGDPMIVHSANGTNAGTIENVSYGHVAA
jgi:hypothetical protein